jgi:hypothetical protein
MYRILVGDDFWNAFVTDIVQRSKIQSVHRTHKIQDLVRASNSLVIHRLLPHEI